MEDNRDLIRRLAVAFNIADGAYYRLARSSGVSWHTLSLLYALDDGQPHSQKQICQEWLIPKTTINTVVKSCEKAGYVTLQAMPGRTRQRQICLTEAGRDYAKQTLDGMYRAEEAAMAGTLGQFSPEFVSALERFAEELRLAAGETPPRSREKDFESFE